MLSFLQTAYPSADIDFVLQLSGIAGFVTYMVGFAALQAELLDGNGPAYALINVIAASLVLVSLISAFNLASVLTQISWIIIGCYGIARHRSRRSARA